MKKIKEQGFTLIELLIVIGLIAILAAIVFVALNPLGRFQDSRNAQRWADVNSILSAIKLYQVDNKGVDLSTIEGMDADVYYQIGVGESTITCSNPDIVLESSCQPLEDLVNTGYLSSIPIDPLYEGTNAVYEYETHYFIKKDANNFITIGACDEEKGTNSAPPVIEVTR